MRIPKSLYLIFVVALLASLLPLTAIAQPGAERAPIEQELLDAFAADGTANFFVKMAIEADLSAAYEIADWDARGQFVYDALGEVAAASQAPVIDYAERHSLDYASFFTTNAVFIRGATEAVALDLAALPGVAYLRLERILDIPDPLLPSGAGIQGFVEDGPLPDAIFAWGITDTHAEQVWALGVRGAGMKVANIDTGVQWNHPALVNQFACPGDPGNADCWRDPSNICGGSACDNNGHGTHTMGTMVALDDPGLTYIAGMAPDATWIACKGCESSSCSDFALNTCADWIVAPGGNPANRPNVVNNSWGGGGGDPWYQAKVIAWRAAGVFPAFSAGNSGSGCGTLGTPGDYQESLGSAAHDVNRNIASFSSRGPSAFGHDPYTKPNISAPGVSVCSTVPTNGWSCGYSGTSMASPHTAGAVALLWAGCPDYVGQMELTFEILQNNADAPPAGNCGAPPDGEGNYTFGYGYLNALAAVEQCIGGVEFGTLQGHVYDELGNPIQGASVTAQPAARGGSIDATTDPNGFYTMQLVEGTYNVTASKANYTSQTVTGVGIVANQTTVQNFSLTFLGAWTQIALPGGCPDWTRFDAEYYEGTGFAYIMGGRYDTLTYGDIYRFDPVTQTCTDTGVNMPTPISNYTINQVNNGMTDLLCTFGGRDSAGVQTLNVQCYNPVANTVAVVATLPAAYSGYVPGAQAVVNNRVYVFGGFNPNTAPYELARTDRFNPLTNTFTQIGNLSQARSYIDAAVVDGKIYAFGGTVFDGVNLNAQTRTEVMADPGGAGTWNNAAVAELPTASAEGRAYGFDTDSGYGLAGKIAIAGGGQWPAETNEALVYNVATNSYDYGFPNLNTARRDHAGFFVPGTPGAMWVFGGRTGGVDTPPYAPPEYFEVAFGAQPAMFVQQILMLPYQLPSGPRLAIGAVRIWDENNSPVPGATVSADWTIPPSPFEYPRQCVTNPNGVGIQWVPGVWSGTYGICVTDVVKAGYTYDPDQNLETCDSINLP